MYFCGKFNYILLFLKKKYNFAEINLIHTNYEYDRFNGLVDFLCSTLKPYELKQVCEMLGKYIQKYEQPQQNPYTKEELNAMLDEAGDKLQYVKRFPMKNRFANMKKNLPPKIEKKFWK